MAKFRPGQTVRFTYNQDPARVDENTGDRFKEVFVLNPNYMGKMHGIDLKRLTVAEREVIQAIFDPKTKKGLHKIPLVNDVLRRLNPLQEVKNPMSFYQKFVKVFLRNKDAYRTYELPRMLSVSIVKQSNVLGGVQNPKPLFHKVESKAPPDQAKLDLIRKVAAEKGVGVSSKVGQPAPPGGGVFKKV
jgi:hypothetical protein